MSAVKIDSTATNISSEVEAPDKDFTAIKLDEFFTGGTCLYDIFVKLSQGKYLRVFNKDDPYDKEQVEFLKEDKGIKYLQILTVDRARYISCSQKLLAKVLPLKEIKAPTKFAIARNLLEKYMQELYSLGLSEERLQQGKEICELVAKFVEEEPAIRGLVLGFDQQEPNIYSHAFLTGMIAACISQRFDWKSRQITESILFAAHLCDIGLTQLPPELSKLKIKKMTETQREEYKRHPTLGFSMLEKSKAVNQLIKQVVLQHHEHSDASGFPSKLSNEKILLLAKVVNLCGDFSQLTIDYLLPPKETIDMMFPQRGDEAFIDPSEDITRYDKNILKQFFAFFDGHLKKKGERH